MIGTWWLTGLLVSLLGCTDKGTSDTALGACEPNCDETDVTPDDTGETDTDTGGETTPDACAEPVVTFEGIDGEVEDLTDALSTGAWTTLDAPGTLSVCPGTWFARLLLRADISVVGLGDTPEQTVLSAGESGTILDVGGETVTVDVSNLTLDRGAGLDLDHNSGGGGVYCADGASVFIEDALFTNNFANDGAGLYAQECSIVVNRTVFRDNYVDDDGGAFTLWFSNALLTDVTFQDNEGLDGGAMALFFSEVVATGVSVLDNTAHNFAGGVWAFDSDITFIDSEIAGNINDNEGGGIYVYGSADFQRVSFHDNAAPVGGGLYVNYGATVDGVDCDFSDNTVEDLYVVDDSKAGGQSLSAGLDYSFHCAENSCVED